MSRLSLEDSILDSVKKMADGNPGAAMCMAEMVGAGWIDPDAALGGYGKVIQLDTHGIYGTDIYVLYSDICGKSMVKMFSTLRAVQLGLFSSSTLKDACSRQDRSGKSMIPVEELYFKVKEQLPNFA